MFTSQFRPSQTARLATVAVLMTLPLVFAVANGCGGDNDGATSVVIISPSPSGSPLDSPFQSPSPIASPSPIISPSASPTFSPAPVPSPPPIGAL